MGHSVITIAQQKGGAGKTTIASHLAVALQQHELSVALADIDPQGSLTQWHTIREQCFGKDHTGFDFHTFSGWRMGAEVAELRKEYDVVLIDSPPHVETEARTAIRYADMILVPVQPSPTDLWATEATLTLARKENIPARIILNRVNPTSKIYEAVRDELADHIFATLGNRVIYASSLMEGFGVTEVAPSSPAAYEIWELAERLIKEINRKNKKQKSKKHAEMA